MGSVNIFIKPILIKKYKHDFKAWVLKRKTIKLLNKASPSFDMMCSICEFLTLLREIYMYDNSSKFHLFSATIKNNTIKNSMAMIYKEEAFSIKFILINGNKKQINIEIQRNGQTKNDIEHISFFDGEYKFKDKYDEEKMLFITSSLMSGVIELLEYYYANKRL